MPRHTLRGLQKYRWIYCSGCPGTNLHLWWHLRKATKNCKHTNKQQTHSAHQPIGTCWTVNSMSFYFYQHSNSAEKNGGGNSTFTSCTKLERDTIIQTSQKNCKTYAFNKLRKKAMNHHSGVGQEQMYLKLRSLILCMRLPLSSSQQSFEISRPLNLRWIN